MFEADVHEPTDIVRILAQVFPELYKTNLNEEGFADYYWDGESMESVYPGHNGEYQLERKTVVDLVNGIESIEDQLRRQNQLHPHCRLRAIIEGDIEPAPGGVTVYTRQSGRDNMKGTFMRTRPGMYESIIGAILGWNEFLEVHSSASYVSTAHMILEMYKRDQKPEEERETFKRYFKVIDWNPNKQVVRAMGAAGNDSNFGVKKAEAAIKVFGTAWALFSASPEEIASKVPGLSVDGARLLLRNFGRLDVPRPK